MPDSACVIRNGRRRWMRDWPGCAPEILVITSLSAVASLSLRLALGSGLRVYFGLHGKSVVVLLGGGDQSSQTCDIRCAHQQWQQFTNHAVQSWFENSTETPREGTRPVEMQRNPFCLQARWPTGWVFKQALNRNDADEGDRNAEFIPPGWATGSESKARGDPPNSARAEAE